MRTIFLILIVKLIFGVVYSNQIIAVEDSIRFLAVSNDSSALNQTMYLDLTSSNRVSLKPIRCFWLEANSGTVFDLKNLQRPFNKKT